VPVSTINLLQAGQQMTEKPTTKKSTT